ncbi:nestin isoform X2 [Spatholobus suberectus]|nr:nestin isoform X2 [Spatholobus suberectus]
MDFHGMKRKKLQALCKKHGIPANLKNKEMADRLSFIFKGKEIEDPVSCQLNSDNAGTKKNTLHCASGKDILNVEMIDLVSPSQGLEERSDFSAKVLKSSEIERLEFKTNLSPEITREDFGICGVEEDMKSGLNKEQVGNSQEGLHSATGEVALEEFGNHLVEGEGEVEMLGDQTNLPEDVCETGKAGTETEKQEDNANNPEGSNRNYMNLSLVSQISLSPASERMIGFSPKMLNNSETEVLQSETNFSPETLKFDIEICDVKENIQIDVNKEQVGDSQEVVHAAPNVTAISDEDLEQVPSEEFGDHPMEGEVEKLGDKNNLEDVCANGKGRDEAVERGDHNSPQGSNMKDVNVIHVSQEEFGYLWWKKLRNLVTTFIMVVSTILATMDPKLKPRILMERPIYLRNILQMMFLLLV